MTTTPKPVIPSLIAESIDMGGATVRTQELIFLDLPHDEECPYVRNLTSLFAKTPPSRRPSLIAIVSGNNMSISWINSIYIARFPIF